VEIYVFLLDAMLPFPRLMLSLLVPQVLVVQPLEVAGGLAMSQ